MEKNFWNDAFEGPSQLESEVIVLNQLTMNKKVLVELAELVVS